MNGDKSQFTAAAHRLVAGFGNPNSSAKIDFCRWYVAVCQAVTIFVTWGLWKVRDFPPMLPASWFPTVAFDTGLLMLVSLCVCVLLPRYGPIVHALSLCLAIGMDQARLQPQIIACAILLLATIPSVTHQGRKVRRDHRKLSGAFGNPWLFLGRAHLVSMWFYAGFHKLVSRNYYAPTGTTKQFLGEYLNDGPVVFLSVVAAVAEVAVGVMLLVPKTRKPACVVALLLHVVILTSLVTTRWNSSVWSWNIAVVVCAFVFFWSWSEAPLDNWKSHSPLMRLVVAAILILPMGYYFELTDSSISHCLYSRNKPVGFVFSLDPVEH